MDQITQSLGYLASSLVLMTFLVKDMRRLRWIAIASNLAFIAYAGTCGLLPILVLHVLLLPVNVVRLRQLRNDRINNRAVSPARPRYRRRRQMRERSDSMNREPGRSPSMPHHTTAAGLLAI